MKQLLLFKAPQNILLDLQCRANIFIRLSSECFGLLLSVWDVWHILSHAETRELGKLQLSAYRLIMQGICTEKGSSLLSYHPLFPSIVSFHISSPFWSHLTLISHLMGSGSYFFLRSTGMRRSLLFNQSLLRLPVDWSHVGTCTSLTIQWFFFWVMISEPDLSSSHLTVRYCHSGETMGSAGHVDLD